MTPRPALLAALLALALPSLASAATAVTTAQANLRRAPDVQAPVLAVVPPRTLLVVACQGDWCRASYGGRGGYLARALTRPVSVSAPLAGRGARFYLDCAAVRSAGRAPLRLGQPGYRAPLDPNHNGRACERGE